MEKEEIGYIDGDICNRNGCTGIIKEHPVENCRCHLDPPCSECVSARGYCKACGWDAEENGLELD